jgi:hypothetical protein
MPIKDSLVKSIFKFVFEIEVGFDQVSLETKKSLTSFVKKLEKQTVFDEWVETEYNNLSSFSDELKNICKKLKTGEKIQTKEFEFLNEKKVFNDILELNHFKDENRNTKKDLVLLLNNIYKTLQLIKKGKENNLSEEELDELYNKCISKIEQSAPVAPVAPVARQHQPPTQPQLPQNFLGGGSLQNLVTDMLGEFQKGDLNPMDLLQDIMKGPENINKEGSVINKFAKKYENRFNDDSVKKEIEEQFGSIMKNLKN